MGERWALGVLLLGLAGPAAAQVRSVTLLPPARDFGVLVGDVMTARAVIEVAEGTVLDARTLPSPGPVSAAVDVRGVTVAAAGGRVVVAVTYQSFVAPEQVMRAEVPGYAVEFVAKGARVVARVPGFGFAVSPFRHDLQPAIDPAVLRPDHPAGRVDGSAAWARLWVSGVVALVAACVGVGTLGWRAGGAGPFAAASRRMGRDGVAADLLALHRAFDATAGQLVFAEDVDGFLARHARFAGLRGEIEGFFAASRAAFFGGAPVADAPGLAGLGRALARAERRG